MHNNSPINDSNFICNGRRKIERDLVFFKLVRAWSLSLIKIAAIREKAGQLETRVVSFCVRSSTVCTQKPYQCRPHPCRLYMQGVVSQLWRRTIEFSELSLQVSAQGRRQLLRPPTTPSVTRLLSTSTKYHRQNLVLFPRWCVRDKDTATIGRPTLAMLHLVYARYGLWMRLRCAVLSWYTIRLTSSS